MHTHRFSALARFLSTLSLLFIGLPTQAASFDCKNASTTVEKAICSQSELSTLDDKLHDIYQRLLAKARDKSQVRNSQRHWLKVERNPCGTNWCIASAYKARIRELHDQLVNIDPASGTGGKFVLAYDLPKVKRKYMPVLPPGGPGGFCQAFTDNLNQFRQLDFDTCSPRLSPKYPRFSQPTWQEIPLNLTQAKKMMDIQHNWWKGWLEATKDERAAGKVKMWQMQADILGDDHLESLLRLDHALTGYPKPSCSYFDSDQMLVNAPDKIMKAYSTYPPFVATTLGNDLIYDSITKRYYVLAWNRDSYAHVEGEDAYIPNYQNGGAISHPIGAKSSVVVYVPLPRGPWPICWIDWVPANTNGGNHAGSRKNEVNATTAPQSNKELYREFIKNLENESKGYHPGNAKRLQRLLSKPCDINKTYNVDERVAMCFNGTWEDPCDTGSTYGTSVCRKKTLDNDERKLNEDYEKTLKILSSTKAGSALKLQFINSQKKWIKYRDAMYQFEFNNNQGEFSALNECLSSIIEHRISVLPGEDLVMHVDGSWENMCGPGSPHGTYICAKNIYHNDDKELNKLYQLIFARLNVPAKNNPLKKQFIKSERAWIKYRDAICHFASNTKKGSSTFKTHCLISITENKINAMKAFLNGCNHNLPCSAPW